MDFIRVRNFDRFQHYRDRAPPWIKLYNELLDDYDFACLQDASKMHLIGIWLLASRTENKIPADPKWIGKRISATEKVDLSPLIKAGFIERIQEIPNVEHVASSPLADRKQNACPEGEGEGETEQRESREETEGDAGASQSAYPPDFETFWKAYPRKVGKGAALAAWQKARKLAEPARIVASLDRKWPEQKFIPHPATFLNQRRWEDEIRVAQPVNIFEGMEP